MNYIHQNVIKRGLVKSIDQWEFSSYRDYTNLQAGTLCNKRLGFDLQVFRKTRLLMKVEKWQKTILNSSMLPHQIRDFSTHQMTLSTPLLEIASNNRKQLIGNINLQKQALIN